MSLELENINLGATAGDKTGDGARTGGGKINRNFEKIKNFLETPDAILVQTGYELVGQNLTFNSGWKWRIATLEYTNPEDVEVPFPLAASGKSRLDVVVLTTSNTFLRVDGAESTSTPVAPSAPSGSLYVTVVLVTDGAVNEPEQPEVNGAYVQKSERANVYLTGSGVINQLDLVDEKATIVFKGSITRLNTISYASVPYNGKRITLFNAQATPVTIGHSVSGYGVDFIFSDEQDYILKPNETIEFSFDITYAPYAHHMFIGADKRAVAAGGIYYLSQEGCISDADLSLGSSTFGTDNTTAIQNILNLASVSKPLRIYWDGRYSVTGLNIKSNTTIIAKEGCGAILRDNSNKAIFSNENAIPVSMPGVFPDSNISIYGGIWNGNGYRGGIPRQMHSNSTYGFVTGIRMYGVKDVVFENLRVINTRTYAVLFHTNENVVVNNLDIYQGDTVYVNQDGLDFDGYQNNIRVNGLRAKCGDDAITLNTCLLKNGVDAGDYTVYFGKSGPATNVDFQNLYFDNSQMGIRLLSGNKLIDNVTIRNVHGVCQAYWLIIDNYLQNPAGLEDAGPGNVGNVLIENIKVTNLSGTAYSGNFAKGSINCNVENLTLRNYVRKDFGVNNNPSLMVNGVNTVVRFLNIENYYSYDSSTVNTINHFLIDKATVNNIYISGYCERADFSNDSPLLKIVNSAKVDRLFLNGVTVLGSNNVLDNSANLSYIRAVGIHHKANDNTTATFKTTTIVNDIVLSNYYGFLILSGAFASTRGDGFLSSLPPNPPSQLLLNLKAYWKLDESSGNAIDSSGNANTLINTNSVSYTASKINNGVSFNGTSNFLTSTFASALSKISINTWVNLGTFAGIQMLYSNEERAASKYGVSLYTNGSVSGNKLIFSIGNGATRFDRVIPDTLLINTWYMVTFTFDSNSLKVYVNGILRDSATLSFSSIGSNTANRFRLGAEAGATPLYYYSGKIDEFGLWDKVLNSTEITEIYNAGAGKSYPF